MEVSETPPTWCKGGTSSWGRFTTRSCSRSACTIPWHGRGSKNVGRRVQKRGERHAQIQTDRRRKSVPTAASRCRIAEILSADNKIIKRGFVHSHIWNRYAGAQINWKGIRPEERHCGLQGSGCWWTGGLRVSEHRATVTSPVTGPLCWLEAYYNS